MAHLDNLKAFPIASKFDFSMSQIHMPIAKGTTLHTVKYLELYKRDSVYISINLGDM